MKPSIIGNVFILAFISIFSITLDAQIEIAATDIRTTTIDHNQIKTILQSSLNVESAEFENGQLIELPYLNGTIRFRALETNLMDASFAAEFPEIKTYKLQSEDDPSIFARITLNDKLFYASVFNRGRIVTINPIDTATNLYEVNGTTQEKGPDWCEHNTTESSIVPTEKKEETQGNAGFSSTLSNGNTLRTLDFALVCTGEFYQANGNSLAAATTVAVNSINAIEAIFENDVAVNFNLLTPFMYTNPTTDPFNAGLNRTNEAAAAVDANFAQNSYDIGHVFHDQDQSPAQLPGGGVAYVGVICNNNPISGGGYFKGGGWSGSFSNTNNGWYQLAAHEIGHMFNCPHTFNGNGNGCANPPATSAYEIGSGTTIMSYNGLCSAAQNVPDSGTANNYFHAHSIDQMINQLLSTSCYATSSSGNSPPVSNAGLNYTIPKSTPFELTGSATDANGDALTYCWEQYDEDGNNSPTHGFTGATAGGSAIAPLFRSFPPTPDNNRIFPSLPNILTGNNTGVTFEALPSVARTMNFRMGVRDNRANAGGYSCDNMSVTVSGNSGPFDVTSQNVATTWNADGTSTATITWSVNNTTAAPVSCPNVDILLSVDGGNTFPYTLASNTANDGSFTVVIPSYVTSIGRIKIVCSNNIFFDINNADIEITSSCLANGANFSPTSNVAGSVGTAGLNLGLAANFDNQISFPLTSTLSGAETSTSTSLGVLECSNNTCTNFGGATFTYDGYEFYVSTAGTYTFSISATFNASMQLFTGGFNPNSGCSNLLGMSRCYNSPNTLDNNVYDITVNLTPGILYSFSVSDFFFGTTTGSYTISIPSSPAGSSIYDGPNIPPSSGFNYTFIVVNTATNAIAGFTTTGDLRSFPAGTYKVYGISYSSAANLNSFVGSSFTTFQNSLATLVVCGNLSTNCITATITGSSNCPINFSSTAGGQPALTGTESGTADYETNGLIESTQVIAATATVDYDSASEITMNAGFQTILGAIFHAFIDGCGGTMIIEEEGDNEVSEDETGNN